MRPYRVDPGTSSVVVQARSSVGPIAWEVTDPVGSFTAEVADGKVLLDPPPTGEITIRLENFKSGNAVYDAELLKRINARQFPEASVSLTGIDPVNDRAMQARGRMTMHGETRELVGLLEVELRPDESVVVTGQHLIDIRDFDIPTPQMLMLKIFPDVRVFLFVRGIPAED